MLPCLDLALLDPPAQAVKARTVLLLGEGVVGDKGKGKGGGKGGKDSYPAGKARPWRSLRQVHRPVCKNLLRCKNFFKVFCKNLLRRGTADGQ